MRDAFPFPVPFFPRCEGPGSRYVAPVLGAAFALLLAVPWGLAGQDTNILHPIDYIESRLTAPELHIADMDYARPLEGDRSRRVTLAGVDGEPDMEVHWKPVGRGGEGFNNEPRYELAAYRLQAMFLDEEDYVVPPTVLRSMPLEEYQQIRSVSGPTISGTRSVLFLLSYWIQNLAVDTVDPFEPNMFEWNPIYRWHWGNVNILTHLIDHKDANHGNILVSMDGTNPRVFSVDNDIAFRSQVSDQGDRWRRLLVDRLPDRTVERLREITLEQLDAELGVVAEFQIVDGHLEPVEPGENLRPGRGVRVTDERVQFGLTDREIRDVYRNIERLLDRVDRGQLATFPRETFPVDGEEEDPTG
jgi:hypothetical protein